MTLTPEQRPDLVATTRKFLLAGTPDAEILDGLSKHLRDNLQIGDYEEQARQILREAKIPPDAQADAPGAEGLQAAADLSAVLEAQFKCYVEFINALFVPDEIVCFALIGQTGVRHDFVSVSRSISREYFDGLQVSNEQFNVFIGMNAYKAELIGKSAGRTKENVLNIKRLYADADFDGENVRERILSSTKIPPPNAVLQSSPGKYQFIWNVSGLTQDVAEGLLKAIAQEFHTDPAVAEIARVLRVPGFKNLKYPERPEVKVIGEIDNSLYDVVDFQLQSMHAFEPKPDAEIPRDENNLIPHGFIHNFMLVHAGKLRAMGLGPEVIETALLELVHANCRPPIDDEKIRQMARSICTYPAGEPTVELVLTQATSTSAPIAANELVTVRASKVKTQRLEWLWQQRIPKKKLTLFCGDPDNGKSLVSLYVVSQVSRGLPLYGDTDAVFPPSEVLMLIGEDDLDDTVVPRLQAAQADIDKIHFLTSVMGKNPNQVVENRDAQLDRDIVLIEQFLHTHPEVRVIVIDPLSNFLGRVNMNKEQEVRSVLTPLKSLAERRNVSILLVMHLNKRSDESAIHRIGGAMAFTGLPRASWLFMQNKRTENPDSLGETGSHLMLSVKGNLARKKGGLSYAIESRAILTDDGETSDQPFIRWTGLIQHTADDLLMTGQARAGRGRPRKAENAETWLVALLFQGRESLTDIIRAGSDAGFSRATLYRVKDKLRLEDEVIDLASSKRKRIQWVKEAKDGRTAYWELAEMTSEEIAADALQKKEKAA